MDPLQPTTQSSEQSHQSPTTPIPPLPHQPERLLPKPHKTSWGALIGIVIILAVLVVSALYFWGAKLAEREATFQNSNTHATTESPASE